MKKNNTQSLTILLGCLLAVAIVCAQLFHFQVNPNAKKEAKTEQNESDRTTDEAFISLPSFSLPSSVHIHANLDLYCLFEILFEDHRHKEESIELQLSPQKLFTTLFRVIISPNAP